MERFNELKTSTIYYAYLFKFSKFALMAYHHRKMERIVGPNADHFGIGNN